MTKNTPLSLEAKVLTKMIFSDKIPVGDGAVTLHPGDQVQIVADGGNYFKVYHAGAGVHLTVEKDNVQILPRQTQPMNTADSVTRLLIFWERNADPELLTEFYGEHVGPHLWEKWRHTYNRNTLKFYTYLDLANRRQFIRLCKYMLNEQAPIGQVEEVAA